MHTHTHTQIYRNLKAKLIMMKAPSIVKVVKMHSTDIMMLMMIIIIMQALKKEMMMMMLRANSIKRVKKDFMIAY